MLCLTDKMEMYVWGYGEKGQLGLGNTNHQLSPILNSAVSDVVQVEGNVYSSFVINKNGELYACEYARCANLGMG